MAILSLSLEKAATKEEINEYLRQVSLHSGLQEQIDFTNSTEVVSSDYIGSRSAGVFDAQATIVNGNRANLYVWYDNEMGYSCQVMRLAEQVAGTQYIHLPVGI